MATSKTITSKRGSNGRVKKLNGDPLRKLGVSRKIVAEISMTQTTL